MSATNYDETNISGKAEDVSDIITNISPHESPFQSGIGRDKAEATTFEWQTDALRAAVSNNAKIDGAAFAHVAPTATSILRNDCQIVSEGIEVSFRADAVKKYGRAEELGYQVAKIGKALKTDLEASLTANQVRVASAEGTAPRTAGLPAWLTTHADRGAGGADGTLSGGFVDAGATDGTLRELSWEGLMALCQSLYIAGGREADTLMAYPSIVRRISDFLLARPAEGSGRVVTPYQQIPAGQKSGINVIGSVQSFLTPFGMYEMVPNLFQRERDVFLLDLDLFDLCVLRDWRTKEEPFAGDARRRTILFDGGLKSRQEAGSAVFADVMDAAVSG